MQTGDQFKQMLAQSLAPQTQITRQLSQKSDHSNLRSGKNSASDSSGTRNNKYKRGSRKSTLKGSDDSGTVQTEKLALTSIKKNFISEGPLNMKNKRSNPVQRRQQQQQQQQDPATRGRIFSSDVIEIQLKKVDQAEKYRKSAYDLYKRGDYFDSLTQLHKAVKVFKVDQLTASIKKESEKVYNIIKECYLFSASCYVKINQFDSAIQLMNELIDVEPNNNKALYLRGKAHYHRKEIVQAYRDFSLGLSLEPDNQILSTYVSTIKQKIPNIDQKLQEFQASPLVIQKQQSQTDKKPQTLPRSKFYSMNSTANSSESYPSIERETQLQNEFSIHPPSPSHIKIDIPESFEEYEEQKSQSQKNQPFNYMKFLQNFWKQHKPEFAQMLKTVIVLLLLLALKKIVQALIPKVIKQKFMSLISN